MSLDISTTLNVLGLVLTVLFFVVGYRQTIGARKERARAANKRIVDTLFRRLTHEDSFSLSSRSVRKLLDGWALDARIRSSDMLGADELEAILIARVLENDYISPDQRQAIVTRVRGMFKQESLIALSSDIEELPSKKRQDAWVLALGSGIAAIATSIAATSLAFENATAVLRDTDIRSAAVLLTIVVMLTAGATAIYSSLRDASRSVRIEGAGHDNQAGAFERNFSLLARKHIPTLAPSEDRALDFMFSKNGAMFGIEAKHDINRLGKIRYNVLRRRLKEAAERLNLEKIYLVSLSPPRAGYLDEEDDKVVPLSARDFLADFAPNPSEIEPLD